MRKHAAVEARSMATIASLRQEKDNLEETVGTLLEQNLRQEKNLEVANERADSLVSANEELSGLYESVTRSMNHVNDEKQNLTKKVVDLREELTQRDIQLNSLVDYLRMNVTPSDFDNVLASLQIKQSNLVRGIRKSGKATQSVNATRPRALSPHSGLNSPETVLTL